jgi:D-cysteine desulfhydrase family pyridoxal phosphate-dependent enzyme
VTTFNEEVLERRVRMGYIPTPLQQLSRLGQEFKHSSLWIKRDDLTDVALGGNKVRKLEFHLCAALEAGADTILTFGGPQTNHGRLTAAVAALYGLKCILVLDGRDPGELSGNLILDNLLGADVRFVKPSERSERVEEIVREYKASGHEVFIIPMGGSNALGTLGYVVMMQELAEQIRTNKISPTLLFVAVGSAGTLAGIVLGAKIFGFNNLKIHGIPVFPPGEMEITQLTLDYSREAAKLLGLNDIVISEDDFFVDYGPKEDPYSGLGYNIPDAKTYGAIRSFASREAIFLDPCYTGKAARAYLQFVEQEATADDTVLFVHTGGSPGLWARVNMDYLNEHPQG